MTSELVAPNSNQPVTWMPVVLGSPGAWEWNVKRIHATGWEIVARSDHIYASRVEAQQAAQAFISAETAWERTENDNGSTSSSGHLTAP